MENKTNTRLTSSFDAAAKAYDDSFTFSEIGVLQRDRVYFWLNKIDFFQEPKQVFEVNCGTGYDAEQFFKKGHQVIATDASPEMIRYAKVNRNSEIQFYPLAFENASQDKNINRTNVLFSNFGGLNCLDNKQLSQFVDEITEKQPSEALFIGVLMAKKCFIEEAYHLFTGRWSKLFRRNTEKGLSVDVDGTKVETFYHAPNQLINRLKQYDILLQKPVAFFLPPSYLEPFFKRKPYLLKLLNNLEQFFGRWSFLAAWSDHYIIIGKKR